MVFPVSSRLSLRAFALLASFLLLLVAFLLFVRPWFGNWGATADERRRPLPGDSSIANAAALGTSAMAINAPVERVWGWLSQIGQDRSGFYTVARSDSRHRAVDRLFFEPVHFVMERRRIRS